MAITLLKAETPNQGPSSANVNMTSTSLEMMLQDPWQSMQMTFGIRSSESGEKNLVNYLDKYPELCGGMPTIRLKLGPSVLSERILLTRIFAKSQLQPTIPQF